MARDEGGVSRVGKKSETVIEMQTITSREIEESRLEEFGVFVKTLSIMFSNTMLLRRLLREYALLYWHYDKSSEEFGRQNNGYNITFARYYCEYKEIFRQFLEIEGMKELTSKCREEILRKCKGRFKDIGGTGLQEGIAWGKLYEHRFEEAFKVLFPQ